MPTCRECGGPTGRLLCHETYEYESFVGEDEPQRKARAEAAREGWLITLGLTDRDSVDLCPSCKP